MPGSFNERLRRAEELAASLSLNQRRCPTCRGPIPSMSEVLTLGDGGVYTMGKRCPDCWELGGGGTLSIDAASGKPEKPNHKLVLLAGDFMCFEDWLEVYGHLRFGGAIDNFLAVYRAELLEWAGKLDHQETRTAEQVNEAEVSTRRFPLWGGGAGERFGGVERS